MPEADTALGHYQVPRMLIWEGDDSMIMGTDNFKSILNAPETNLTSKRVSERGVAERLKNAVKWVWSLSQVRVHVPLD